jgi:hypothetical protein
MSEARELRDYKRKDNRCFTLTPPVFEGTTQDRVA